MKQFCVLLAKKHNISYDYGDTPKKGLLKPDITTHCYEPIFDPLKQKCMFLEPKAKCKHHNKTERNITLSFKGTVTLFDPGSLRTDLIGMTNEKLGIYILTKPHVAENKPKFKLVSTNSMSYDRFTYCNLLTNSVYGLVPEGAQYASYRFLETLCHGSIPVIYTLKVKIYWPFSRSISESEWLECAHVYSHQYEIIEMAYDYHIDLGANMAHLIRREKCSNLAAQVCSASKRQRLYDFEFRDFDVEPANREIGQ